MDSAGAAVRESEAAAPANQDVGARAEGLGVCGGLMSPRVRARITPVRPTHGPWTKTSGRQRRLTRLGQRFVRATHGWMQGHHQVVLPPTTPQVQLGTLTLHANQANVTMRGLRVVTFLTGLYGPFLGPVLCMAARGCTSAQASANRRTGGRFSGVRGLR